MQCLNILLSGVKVNNTVDHFLAGAMDEVMQGLTYLWRVIRNERPDRNKLAFSGKKASPIPQRAGDGTRTRDVQLGKLAFYH